MPQTLASSLEEAGAPGAGRGRCESAPICAGGATGRRGAIHISVWIPPSLQISHLIPVPRGLAPPFCALQSPRGPPQGRLASRCGAGAVNGRVNWGKLTHSKTPQHLEKQEPGWGRGPERAIIHPGVLRPPAAPQLGPQPPVSKADKWRTVRL